MTKRQGYSVQITRGDGTTFLSAGSRGILPPVWPLSLRKYAVAHKRELAEQGFRAEVVRVEFEDVVVVDGGTQSHTGGSGES